MIIIKKIEIIETDRDQVALLPMESPNTLVFPCGNQEPVEIIRGRRFRRPSDGTDIIVGVSKQAERIIGIMYESWDNLQKSYDNISKEMRRYRKKVEESKKANFMQRLKWLFKGYS